MRPRACVRACANALRSQSTWSPFAPFVDSLLTHCVSSLSSTVKRAEASCSALVPAPSASRRTSTAVSPSASAPSAAARVAAATTVAAQDQVDAVLDLSGVPNPHLPPEHREVIDLTVNDAPALSRARKSTPIPRLRSAPASSGPSGIRKPKPRLRRVVAASSSSSDDEPETPSYTIPRRAAGRRGPHRRNSSSSSAPPPPLDAFRPPSPPPARPLLPAPPPPTQRELDIAWAEDVARRAHPQRYEPGDFAGQNFECRLCPRSHCTREDNFVSHIRGKSHIANLYRLKPRICRRCPTTQTFSTPSAWKDHLSSNLHKRYTSRK